MTSIRSRKNKGRTLQNLVRDKLLDAFAELYADDIKSAIMGASGEDVLLSPAARKLIPFQFECKNQEVFKTLYKMYGQAGEHGPHEPILVIKMNHEKPLAVLSLDAFLKLIKK